jgi:hypothetical protein
MRSFENTEEFREFCLIAVKDVPYPIQAIWGEDDIVLGIKEYGEEIKKFADPRAFKTLSSRHFLQEEVWKDLAKEISVFADSAGELTKN